MRPYPGLSLQLGVNDDSDCNDVESDVNFERSDESGK